MKKIIAISCFILAACSSGKNVTSTLPPAPPATESVVIYGKLFATLYQQRAAEYKALCFQAYNIARLRVDLIQAQGAKPKAIVTDIDETVLDNSPYEAHQTLQGRDYAPESWYEWTAKSAADTVPGAPSFLKYAASKGIEIFYVTNRDEKERQPTLTNLKMYGLPNADNEHLFLRGTTSSKEARRQEILKTHEIIMLVGDNLADFSNLFDKKNETDRTSNVVQSINDFGNRFIVIPNPSYGDWEGALYNYNYKLGAEQKDSVVRAALKSY